MFGKTYLRCHNPGCGALNWMTQSYLDEGNAPFCRRCNGGKFKVAFRVTFAERIYLLEQLILETIRINRKGVEGADPYWYLKPWLVARVLWQGITIHRVYTTPREQAHG